MKENIIWCVNHICKFFLVETKKSKTKLGTILVPKTNFA